jgi:hypothetical protein
MDAKLGATGDRPSSIGPDAFSQAAASASISAAADSDWMRGKVKLPSEGGYRTEPWAHGAWRPMLVSSHRTRAGSVTEHRATAHAAGVDGRYRHDGRSCHQSTRRAGRPIFEQSSSRPQTNWLTKSSVRCWLSTKYTMHVIHETTAARFCKLDSASTGSHNRIGVNSQGSDSAHRNCRRRDRR